MSNGNSASCGHVECVGRTICLFAYTNQATAQSVASTQLGLLSGQQAYKDQAPRPRTLVTVAGELDRALESVSQGRQAEERVPKLRAELEAMLMGVGVRH